MTWSRQRTFALMLLPVAIGAARLRSYHEPLEWDTGTYTAIARQMLDGKRLYQDAWDIKPPAIFVTYAAAQALVGDGPAHVYLLSVIAAVVTMIGVYRASGVWGAVFWAAMCLEPRTDANLPNTEVFINAATSWTFALWLCDNDKLSRSRRMRSILIGLLIALATLYKHVAIVPAASVAIAEILWPPIASSRKSVLKGIAIIATIVIAAWTLVFAYFALTGRGWLIWQTLVVAPRAYSGGIAANLAASLAASNAFPRLLYFTIPAIALAIIGVWGTSPRRRRLLIALAIGTQVAVALPGGFANHYCQLWFVPLAIGAGWGAGALAKIESIRRRWLAVAVSSLAAIAVLFPQLSWYALDGPNWAWRKRGAMFQWANEAVVDADHLLRPDETFFTWSDEAWAYPLAHRSPPATMLWKAHATAGPMAGWLTQKSLAELEARAPELVLSWGDAAPIDHPIARWILDRYDRLPDPKRRHFPFVFYVLRGGALQGRLSSASLD